MAVDSVIISLFSIVQSITILIVKWERAMKLFSKSILITVLLSFIPSMCSAGAVTKDGYYNGIKLCGKVKVVKSFADIKVQVVKSFPDLKVKRVSSFPDKIGEWKFVDSFPDIKIQYVNSFPGVAK